MSGSSHPPALPRGASRGVPAALLLPLLGLVLLLAAWQPALAQGLFGGAVVSTERVRAELVAHAPEGLAPGRPVRLGLLMRHRPGWHSYWKNPGDSGLPTTFAWQLPAGVEAGEIEWPTPKPLPVGPLVNYGYEDELLLPVTLTVTESFTAPSLEVALRAEWLVCKDVCIPESGDFRLRLPVNAATAGHAALFEAARVARPHEGGPGVRARARIEGEALAIEVEGLPAAWRGRPLHLFVEQPQIVDPAARVEPRWGADGAVLLRAPLWRDRSEAPAALHAVLAPPASPPGSAGALRIGFDVAGAWPPVLRGPAGAQAGAAAAEPSLPRSAGAEGALPASSASAQSLLLPFVFAFVGGLLLNLMPCVFPILSLKVLAFARERPGRRALAASGIAYACGVVASFLVLAALLLGLRTGGEQLGWGFQLQSPPFVAALAALFTLIGLNLAGVFELRGVLSGRLATLRARHPVADQALTGVLAVAVASPCSAPFMGAALGAALAQPTAGALAIFGALGLGMATPYLAASLWPGLADRLPRPGPWMAQFKTLMAFPMFATVVWLVWVLGRQVGLDGAVALLGVLLALAFAGRAWFGLRPARPAGRAALGMLGALALGLSLAWAWPSWSEGTAQAPPGMVAVAGSAAAGEGGAAASAQGEGRWQPWSAEAVAAARDAGRPVFVDFTAAWCVTCQVNKRFALADAGLLADFDARRVLLLRADWTRRDPAITAALAALGRNGVPVYALYPPGDGAPLVLPELLTAAGVRAALAQHASPATTKGAMAAVASGSAAPR